MCYSLQDESVNKVHARVTALKKSRNWESRYMRFDELLHGALKDGIADQIPGLYEDADFLKEMYQRYQL